MFSRRITVRLKAHAAEQVPSVIENDVLPILRKQKGFRDEVVMIAPDRSECIALSFWDTEADAEAYNRTAYPEVLKAVTKIAEGTPKVQTYEVSTSTFHTTLAHTA